MHDPELVRPGRITVPVAHSRLESLVVVLTSPLLWFALVPLVLLSVLNMVGLAMWAVAVWGVGAILLLAAIGAALPPQHFVAKSTLSSETSKVGGLVRGGFGLFVAAVVGAIGAIAVQRDFTPSTSGNGEIMTLLALVGEVLVAVVVVRVLYGIAFRVHIATATTRGRAVSQVLSRAFATVRGTQRLRRALRHPVYLHWHEVFSSRFGYWLAATVGALGTIVSVTLFIQWVGTLS
jgi:hypothetical protein